MRRRRIVLAALFAVAATVVVYYVVTWPRTPTIVESLRALPELGGVQFSRPWQRSGHRLAVIHLRDWHLVSPENCQLEAINYAEHLRDVERVQADQLAIARHLIKTQGLTGV